jgi:hypothetical protein
LPGRRRSRRAIVVASAVDHAFGIHEIDRLPRVIRDAAIVGELCGLGVVERVIAVRRNRSLIIDMSPFIILLILS